jgi:hypothetical protein
MANENVSMSNAYALPDGRIVNLPDHCRDSIERFTIADGSLVWATRVIGGNADAAARLAASMPRPRKP